MLGISSAHIAHPYSTQTGSRAWGDPLVMNRAAALSALQRRLGNGRAKLSPLHRTYREILERAAAKVVVTVGSPPQLAQVARLVGVRHIEVDHGRGRSMVPWSLDSIPSECLPTDFVAFDPDTYATMSVLAKRGVRVHLCEDVWVKRFQESPPVVSSEWQYSDSVSSLTVRRIVVTLQWGYSGELPEFTTQSRAMHHGLLPPAVWELMKQGLDRYRWLVRAHPVQMMSRRYRWVPRRLDELEASIPNFEWRQATKVPLPALLRHATHHVTMMSGATYEAAEMGVPTALLEPALGRGGSHAGDFAWLRSAGWATHLGMDDSKELAAWLERDREPLPAPGGSASSVVQLLFDALK